MSSRIDASMARDDVVPEGRRAMTEARKRRIHTKRKGKCWMCGQPVELDGPGVRYDHKIPLELGGADDDANIWPLHREPCDQIKTAADRKRIDKMRRQSTMRLDREPPKTRAPLRGRKFEPTRDWRGRDCG